MGTRRRKTDRKKSRHNGASLRSASLLAHSAPPGRLASWILITYLVTLTSFYVDTSVTPNSTARIVATLSLLQSGTLDIGPLAEYTDDKALVNGHYYSDKAPLPSWLFTVPLWIVEKVSPAESLAFRFSRSLGLGGFLFASLPLALFGLWLIRDGLSITAAVIVLCGTFLWIYSGTFFSHVFSGFLIVAAHRLTFRRQSPFLAGLCLGAAFLSEYPTALTLPAFALALVAQPTTGPSPSASLWLRSRRIVPLAVGFAVVAAWILPYNIVITGHPLTMAYSHEANPAFAAMNTRLGFDLSSMPEGLWGLLFSPARGLFIYAPITLLLFIKGRSWTHRLRTTSRLPASGLYFIGSVLLFSSYYMWNGGWAYGPRHLIPALMLLVADVAPLAAEDERRTRRGTRRLVLLILGGLGIVPAFAAKVTVQYLVPDVFSVPFTEVIWPALTAGRWNHSAITSIVLGWPPVVSACCFLIVAIGGGAGIGLLTTRGHLTLSRSFVAANSSSPASLASHKVRLLSNERSK